MGNYKWNNNDTDKTLPYVVVLMRSRNKDNKDVENFKERKRAYFRTYDLDKITRDFIHFINDGVKGEFNRLYISLNSRDTNKVKKALLHELIDEENICWDYIEPKIAGIAARRENAAEKKWFFDFDLNEELQVNNFCQDICVADNTLNPIKINTPNGYAVIVDHGFDTRELLNKWGTYATLKRDDLICFNWGITV